MNRLEFRKSRLKALGLLLGAIALVAGGLFLARTGEEPFDRAMGWFGAVFFGLGILKAFFDLFSNDVAYVFDERGIEDHRSNIRLIPWPAITKFEILTVRGTRIILLSLERPEQFLERVPAASRKLAFFGQKVGWGDWSLNFVGLSPGIDEAFEFIARHVAK